MLTCSGHQAGSLLFPKYLGEMLIAAYPTLLLSHFWAEVDRSLKALFKNLDIHRIRFFSLLSWIHPSR